jgi:RNA polymerase sigma factor (sigma-70 family)
MVLRSSPVPAESPDDDATLVRRIVAEDEAAFELLMRHHNKRLYRVARAILKDDADAQDVLQEAYLAAFRHMTDFRADAKLSTWLTRIVINQALARRRRRRRDSSVVPFSDTLRGERSTDAVSAFGDSAESPETATTRADVRRLLESKIDALPVAFRTVFILREVEELSVDETAACLSIPEATVRSRLFRARGLLRESLAGDFDVATRDAFNFDGERCDRIVTGVLQRRGAAAAAATVR